MTEAQKKAFDAYNRNEHKAALRLPAMGYSEATLLRMAGWRQVKDKRSRPEWGEAPSLLEAYSGIGGKAPFGDDPKDQDQISKGYWYYHKEYRKPK